MSMVAQEQIQAPADAAGRVRLFPGVDRRALGGIPAVVKSGLLRNTARDAAILAWQIRSMWRTLASRAAAGSWVPGGRE